MPLAVFGTSFFYLYVTGAAMKILPTRKCLSKIICCLSVVCLSCGPFAADPAASAADGCAPSSVQAPLSGADLIENGAKWLHIFTHALSYPPELLHALRRNPEMLDFVSGYLTTPSRTAKELVFPEPSRSCPLFIQWDSRWGYAPYGRTNIGISGCGPTCLSMVLYYFTGNPVLTPDFLSQKAMDEGYYVDGVGTDWSFMSRACEDYGVNATQYSWMTERQMRSAADDGALIICAMGPGDFTDAGHFIVIRGASEEGFLINDPFSYANSEKVWDYDTLSEQWKQLWVYEPPCR